MSRNCIATNRPGIVDTSDRLPEPGTSVRVTDACPFAHALPTRTGTVVRVDRRYEYPVVVQLQSGRPLRELVLYPEEVEAL